MLLYYLKCKKNTESKIAKDLKTENEKIMLLSKFEACDSKKSRFIKEQESSGLLSSLGIKTPFRLISLVDLAFLEVLTS